MYRKEALTLLRWLAYAQSPPSLGELAEAAIIDPEGEGIVDIANRGPLEDTLEILCGLVVVQRAGDDDGDDDGSVEGREESEEESEDLGTEESDSWDCDVHSPRSTRRLSKNTKIRLCPLLGERVSGIEPDTLERCQDVLFRKR